MKRKSWCKILAQVLPERLHYAIVDEADSILIDESRNPMIISLPVAVNAENVMLADKVTTQILPSNISFFRLMSCGGSYTCMLLAVPSTLLSEFYQACSPIGLKPGHGMSALGI